MGAGRNVHFPQLAGKNSSTALGFLLSEKTHLMQRIRRDVHALLHQPVNSWEEKPNNRLSKLYSKSRVEGLRVIKHNFLCAVIEIESAVYIVLLKLH